MSQEYAAPASVLPVGTTLQMGKYRIVRFIASGGFGNTYEVVNVEFEERMAMKEFFMRGVNEREDDSVSVSVSNADNKQQFETQKEKLKKEARRLRRMHNENIVKVHDLFEENGTVYYVMDYIDGESLSKRIKRTGKPLTEAEVRRILPQLLTALDEVHRNGIWHLDLKPANIMVDSHGKALLIDFGASKQLRSSEGYSVSTSTAMCYTPGYAPMEQIEQDFSKFGPWTDFYALGATLYNLLSAKQPPSSSEITEGNAFAFPPSVSPQMRQLVEWFMQPTRRKRPQSVNEIRDFIKEAPAKIEEEETTVYSAHTKEEERNEVVEQPEDIYDDDIDKEKWWQNKWLYIVIACVFVCASLFIYRGCYSTGAPLNVVDSMVVDSTVYVDDTITTDNEIPYIENENMTTQSEYQADFYIGKEYSGGGNGGGIGTDLTIRFEDNGKCLCTSDWYQAFRRPVTIRGSYFIQGKRLVVKCYIEESSEIEEGYDVVFQFDISDNGKTLSFNHSDPDMQGTIGQDFMTLTEMK